MLATATDSARLVMFKEIAGTVVYDTRRAESETIMLSTSDRMTKVKDMLREGERRLKVMMDALPCCPDVLSSDSHSVRLVISAPWRRFDGPFPLVPHCW